MARGSSPQFFGNLHGPPMLAALTPAWAACSTTTQLAGVRLG
jgi:hypothetical protein